jgi:hypothetical protein
MGKTYNIFSDPSTLITSPPRRRARGLLASACKKKDTIYIDE